MAPHLKLESGQENWVDVEIVPVPQVLQSGTNYKDNLYEKEALLIGCGNEDVEVDITGCTKSSEPLTMGDNCGDDATECSSSFGETGSGTENASAFSDDEVLSHMGKKLTDHWKSFIRPLRWRCKRIELKLKQLQSQELKYEKELAAYDYRRKLISANFSVDECDSKSAPLRGGICGKKVMKRKKRKRVEETCNLASYTSAHRLFSYYEEKDSAAHARLKNVKVVAEARNPENNEELKRNDMSHLEDDSLMSSLDHNDTDKTLLHIFDKIKAAQSAVHKLRTRIDKVVNENVGKSSSVNNLNTLGLGPSNDSNLYDTDSTSLSRIKDTFSEGIQFMSETKESVDDQKPVPLARASVPDLVAKNAVVPNLQSNNLKVCSPLKLSFSGKKRGRRKKSGLNSWAGASLVKPELKK